METFFLVTMQTPIKLLSNQTQCCQILYNRCLVVERLIFDDIPRSAHVGLSRHFYRPSGLHLEYIDEDMAKQALQTLQSVNILARPKNIPHVQLLSPLQHMEITPHHFDAFQVMRDVNYCRQHQDVFMGFINGARAAMDDERRGLEMAKAFGLETPAEKIRWFFADYLERSRRETIGFLEKTIFTYSPSIQDQRSNF